MGIAVVGQGCLEFPVVLVSQQGAVGQWMTVESTGLFLRSANLGLVAAMARKGTEKTETQLTTWTGGMLSPPRHRLPRAWGVPSVSFWTTRRWKTRFLKATIPTSRRINVDSGHQVEGALFFALSGGALVLPLLLLSLCAYVHATLARVARRGGRRREVQRVADFATLSFLASTASNVCRAPRNPQMEHG